MNRERFALAAAVTALFVGVLLISTPNELDAAGSPDSTSTFARLRDELVRHRVQFVIEERPFRDQAPWNHAATSPADLPARIADTFDYKLTKEADILRFRKSYTDLEDRPSFSVEELSAVVDQLLPVLRTHRVDRSGIPIERFIRSFTKEQIVAMQGRSVPVTALPPEQQKLLHNFGLANLLGHSLAQISAARAILDRPDTIRLVWDTSQANRGPFFWCYYADPALSYTPRRLIPMRTVGGGQPRPNSRPAPALRLPPVPPSSRALPYKVKIDRREVTVGDILDEIQAQVSVTVTAPSYFRDRRVSVFVQDVEAGKLLDAMGAVFGWQWDASREGRARLTRPVFTARSLAELPVALWGALPASLRAYLEPAPDRADPPDRTRYAADQIGRRLYDMTRDRLGAAGGLRHADLSPEARQQFLDWFTYDLIGTALGWHTQRVPAWLINPAQTVIHVSDGAFGQASSPEIAAKIRQKLGEGAPTMRIMGPTVGGETYQVVFSLASNPALAGAQP